MPPRRNQPKKTKSQVRSGKSPKSKKPKIWIASQDAKEVNQANSAYDDVILCQKAIKKKVVIGKDKVWKKYQAGHYSMSRQLFKYTEAEGGRLWKAYYGDVCRCAEPACPIQLKIEEHMTKRKEYFVEVMVKGEHIEHSRDYQKKLEKRLAWGIKPEVKALIKDKQYYLLTTAKVLSRLRNTQELKESDIPTYEKLHSFLYPLKKRYVLKNFSSEIINIKAFIKSNLSEQILLKEEDLLVLGSNLDVEHFRITFSSKALLKNCVNQANSKHQGKETPSFLHLDGTYKLLSNGFIVIVVGTEDINHQFRLVALSVVAHENKESYIAVLHDVQNSLKNNFDFILQPSFAMGDGADCIFLAVKEVWPNCTYLLCIFHLKKAITAKINREKNEETKKILKEKAPLINYGVNLLIDTKSWFEFEKLWYLIKANWNEELKLPKVFITYFENEYVLMKKYWHLGASFNSKSRTNNSLENFNNTMKRVYFDKDKQSFGLFLSTIETLIKDFSFTHTLVFPDQPRLKKNIIDKARALQEEDVIYFTQDIIGFRRSRRKYEAFQDRIT